MSNSALLKQAQNAESTVDHSKPTQGGAPRIPVEGVCPARLIGYIELGEHPQPDYQGQAKPPAMMVKLVFECMGKDNIDEIEVDGKKKKMGRIIRPLDIAVKINERAKFYKMFQDMDYGRGIDHMSKMLNDVFRLTIKHKESKTKKGSTYAVIDKIDSPIIQKFDEEGNIIGTTDITDKVPPASYDFQLFIFDAPSFEQWDSIYIDGTYTKKTVNEDGTEVEEEVSKNFIQETIQNALNWDGSAMHTLLSGLAETAKEEVKEESGKKSVKSAETKSEKTASTTKEESTPATVATKSLSDEEAMLAELGL